MADTENPYQSPKSPDATARAAPKTNRLISFALVAIAAGVIGVLVVRGAIDSRRRSLQAGCINHIMGVGFALSQYEYEHGSYPPAYIPAADGTPMHSWRVLILPYLGESAKALYDRYDFNEPWNGEHNRRLIPLMPDEFRCPAASGNNGTNTSYLAVVGPNTAWGPKPLVRPDVKDWRTILVVESSDSDICWMEPKDLPFERAAIGVNVDKSGIFSHHSHGANAVFVDCNPHGLPAGLPAESLRDLLRIDASPERKATAYPKP